MVHIPIRLLEAISKVLRGLFWIKARQLENPILTTHK